MYRSVDALVNRRTVGSWLTSRKVLFQSRARSLMTT